MYLYVSIDTHFCKNLKPMSLVTVYGMIFVVPTLHSLLLQAPRQEICVSSTSRPRCQWNSKLFLVESIGKLGNYLVTIRVSNPGQGFFLGGGGIRYTRWWFEIVSMFTPNIGEI